MRELMIAGGAVVAVLIAVFGAPWLLTRIARRYGANDVPSRTPRYVYTKADESLPIETAKKRAEAEALRRRAALVDAGPLMFDVKRTAR